MLQGKNPLWSHCHKRWSASFPEVLPMKRFLIAAIIVAALYFADQYYAAGKYTRAVGQLTTQMRHSFGV
jgi:hypothetical protein